MLGMTAILLGGGGNGGGMSKSQRLVLGFTILIVVDLIWVVSSELTTYLVDEREQQHASSSKPYFSTFVRCSMLAVYLAGFLLHRSWWYQCRQDNPLCPGGKEEDMCAENVKQLGDPVFVPIKFDGKYSGGADSAANSESEDASGTAHTRSVRFNRLSEVRQLSAEHAEDALLARLSYAAFMRAEKCRLKAANKLSVRQICKIAAIFSFILFFGHLSYQEALKQINSDLVNVLFSLSALFTLALASVFPASNADRFTLSKFVAVALSIGGIVLMSWGSLHRLDRPVFAVWPVLCALLLALFLVMLRRRVDHEQKLNMPMFYGFLGFFTLVLLWPGLLILHFTQAEVLEWPDTLQWVLLLFNGLVGMVISNLLWLWGCFLTSSLAATLSLTLIVPMTTIAGVLVSRTSVPHGWMFYVGLTPVFVAFFAVGVLTHYDNCDPVLLLLQRALQLLQRGLHLLTRGSQCSQGRGRVGAAGRFFFFSSRTVRDGDREQSESLIGVNTDRADT